MYKVEFLVDGGVEDSYPCETLEKALQVAAEWIQDAAENARDWVPNERRAYEAATIRVVKPNILFQVEV